jgi:hypothetical protein
MSGMYFVSKIREEINVLNMYGGSLPTLKREWR